MKIGDFDLNKNILIVAEIGNNHEGNYALAEKMIQSAAKAGADAVKFQVIVPDKLVTIQNKERIKQLKKFQLTYKEFEKLSKIAKQEGILFLSTPFDLQSVYFLESLVPAFKISSGDNNFFPLIDAVARTGKPIIMSTGLADMEQISVTKNFIENIWHECKIIQEMAMLHCVTSYPTMIKEANLLAIKALHEYFGITVGYSDHTVGIDASVLSVVLGARIVEKHFTVDKNYSDFHDHHLSADPKEFAFLVKKINETAEILGNGLKVPQRSESININNIRRSIVAGHELKKGAIIKWDDLNWVRPGGGLSPGQEKDILDKILKKSIKKGEMIFPDDVFLENEKGKN